jgi:hypothetical protein
MVTVRREANAIRQAAPPQQVTIHQTIQQYAAVFGEQVPARDPVLLTADLSKGQPLELVQE